MAKSKKSIIDKNIEKFINENFDSKDRKKMLQNTLNGLLTQCIFVSIQVFFLIQIVK